MEDEDEE